MKVINRKAFMVFLNGSIPWLIAWGLASSANGASITGELYSQTDGNSFPASFFEHIQVEAYLEDPLNPGACNSTQDDRWYTAEPYNYQCDECTPEREIVGYSLEGPGGTYYLRTVEGWWDGEQGGGGTQDCAYAEPIILGDEEHADHKDFTINTEAVISGAAYLGSESAAPVTTNMVVTITPIYMLMLNNQPPVTGF